jgi:hypothetical protein
MIAAGESLLNRARIRITTVAVIPPAKADAVMETMAVPKITTAAAAPKAAPKRIPMVTGDPRGFLKNDWMLNPDKESPHPQKMAAATRGIRIWVITTATSPSAWPVKARSTSFTGMV